MTEKTIATPFHSPGFIERLHKTFDELGIPRHGRMALVARITDMSLPGAKGLFDKDKPPKRRDRFDKLLCDILERYPHKTSSSLNKGALENYLLNNGPDPFRPNEGFSFDEFTDDPVYICDVIVRINMIARELSVDLHRDFKNDQHRMVYTRAIDYCRANKPGVNSDNLRTIVTSLIQLAQQDLL